MFRLLTILSIFFSTTLTAAPSVKEIDLVDSSRQRPIKIRIWSDDSSKCQSSNCYDNAPLMLLSHGAFGSPREYNWLAYALAANGWNVIAPAHYGESWVYGKDTINPIYASRFDLRVQDLQYLLDNLDTIPGLAKLSNAEKIVISGHSSGGFTALLLAGAEFDASKMAQFCTENYDTDKSCQYGNKSLPSTTESTKPAQKSIRHNKQIDGVIVLDPVLGPGATAASLATIHYPTLIIGSEKNDFLSYSANAKYYAEHIRNTELVTLSNNEGHFVYLDECNHPNQAMGVSLCKDRAGVSRKAVHDKMIKAVLTFIHTRL